MANHPNRSRWLSADGLRDPAVGRPVILRRLVTRNGQDVSRYVTNPDERTDDHVTDGPHTSICDGKRTIAEVRRNKRGDVTHVALAE